MNLGTEGHPEFDQLLGALRDGTIGAADMSQLEELLISDSEARQYYREYMELCATLHHYEGLVGEPEGVSDKVVRDRPGGGARGPARPAYLAVLALLIVAVGFLLANFLTRRYSPPTAYAGAVAILGESVDAQWASADFLPREGAALRPGRLRLESGLARVEFYSGAQLILEGPVDLELKSTKRGVVWGGKVRVRATPAADFTLETPRSRLLHGGAEYGVQVSAEGDVEVQVFQGELAWVDREAGPLGRSIPGEKGLLTTRQGGDQEISAHPDKFVDFAQLEERSASASRDRYAAWFEASQRLREDPDVVVYYAFERDAPGSSHLENVASTASPETGGEIIGCQWSEGRWPEKRALDFKRPGDRVRLNPIPGKFESLTLMAWVRLDALDRAFSALFLTDRWDLGGVHWQVMESGQVELSIRDEDGEVDYDTPVNIESHDLGHWMHLAAVYDPKDRVVTHYIDGKVVSRERIQSAAPLVIGSAELGNWGVPVTGDPDPTRSLNGRIDEFILFRRALRTAEIRGIYEEGKPRG